MYQALYRKYRPQTFDDVIGQNHITQTLKNQVQTGHLSHAYIFIGTRGTGKTTCARILAKAVNCEHPINGNPCCECDSCKGIADGSIMDIVELDAASNNGVDNVRALRDEAVFSPANAKKRVYIIDEVHMLSTPAFNALLKILEEPPEHLIFVLATTELQKVPATILSRCQRHIFKRIDLDYLADYLETISKNENLKITHEAAKLIAGLGEGSVRDALSILDQCSSSGNIDVDEVFASVGLAGNKRISSLYNAIISNDIAAAISEFDKMWVDGKDPTVILKELSNLNRDVLMLKIAPKTATSLIYGGYDLEELKLYSSIANERLLCFIADEINRTLSTITNPKMNAELCIVKLCSSDLFVKNISVHDNNITPKSTEPILKKELAKPEAHYKEEPNAADIPPFDVDITYTNKTSKNTVNIESLIEKSTESDNVVLNTIEDENVCDTSLWRNICSVAKPNLSFDIGLQLNDSNVVTGELNGDTLSIKVVPGFYFSRFNRQEVISEFSASASKVCGRNINVKVLELIAEQKNKRSLDELSSFPDVKFI